MAEEAGTQYDADAQIAKGLRFIDRKGRASITGGALTLYKATGDVIASAPITEVRADKARWSAGGAVRVWMGEESYSIQPLRLGRVGGGYTPGDMAAANLGRDIKRIKRAREFTQQFLEALQDAGARMGKPD